MSSFGKIFRVTNFGEPNSEKVGVIIDGVPSLIKICAEDIQNLLKRRNPPKSAVCEEKVGIHSGIGENNVTLGTPICISVDNRVALGTEGTPVLRASQADWSYIQKYGIKSKWAVGRSTARETIGRICAGAVAEKYMKQKHNTDIVAFVYSVGEVSMDGMPEYPKDSAQIPEWKKKWSDWWNFLKTVSRSDVDKSEIRCPSAEATQKMVERINAAKRDNSTIGGTVVCVIRNVAAGLGEPCFDKLQACLAHSMLSIPACKSFEIGSGLQASVIPGHEHNDLFVLKNNKVQTATNFSGGILGGISSGNDIYFKVGFKSVSATGREQATITYNEEEIVTPGLKSYDACILARVPQIVESMAAITIMDALCIQNSRKSMTVQHLTSSSTS